MNRSAALETARQLAACLAPVPPSVAHSAELQRILEMPRRKWSEDDPAVAALVERLTTFLKAPGGTRVLRAIQAVALAELYYHRGLFAPMRVGSGKTDITFNAPVVLGSTRPVLCIPAKLRAKTIAEFGRLYKDWRGPSTLRIFSYEEIARDYADEGLGILDLANPDVLMLDEVHRLKNEKAACTRKIRRYVRAHPEVIVIALSGTITKRSIKDYAHLLVWCLKQGAPIPRGYEALQEWAHALDVNVAEQNRLLVGALLQLALPEDWRDPPAVEGGPATIVTELVAARRGYRRRLVETPGIVSYSKEYTASSLYIEATEPPYTKATDDAFENLRKNWQLPTGEMVVPVQQDKMTGIAKWAYSMSLSLGFFYMPKTPPPEEWRYKRTEWYKGIREVLRQGSHQRGLIIDSPKAVADACLLSVPLTGEHWESVRRRYQEWKVIEPKFTPEKQAVWIDDGPLEHAIKWMHAHRGVVWTRHIEYAERLARHTGAAYFGAGGTDARGRIIEDANPRDDKLGIIASINSNSEGRNIQREWFEGFVTACPTGGDEIEQLLGRFHREEQPSDEVNFWIVMGSREQCEAWLQAKADSHYMTDGSPLGAKILMADQVVPDAAEVERRAKTSPRYWGVQS